MYCNTDVYVAAVLSQNTKLEELDISHNNLQAAGAIKVFQSIKCISTLTKLNIAHNMITDEATQDIVDGLSSNKRLRDLNLSNNSLKNAVTFKSLKIPNASKLNFSNNNIDEKSANQLSLFLSHCSNLQVLDLSCNNLQTAGVIKILNGLDIYTLIKFNISNNGITIQAASRIAEFLIKNNCLEEIDTSYNYLKEIGIRNILKSINISNLNKLNISHNCIAGDLKQITDILTHASKLVELDLSYNKLVLRI